MIMEVLTEQKKRWVNFLIDSLQNNDLESDASSFISNELKTHTMSFSHSIETETSTQRK